MADALYVHGGVTGPKEARLADAGGLALQGPTVLDVRTGVMHGPGSLALLVGTGDTGPMTVAINTHHWVTSRGAADGPYRGALEALAKVPIDAAPASGSRIDVVYVKQQDKATDVRTPDAVTAPLWAVYKGQVGQGKPNVADIVGAEELGTVTVNAGATSTNGAGVTIATTARQTVPRGAPIPVRNQAERDALTPYIGLDVKRLDAACRVETCTAVTNGTGTWTYPPLGEIARTERSTAIGNGAIGPSAADLEIDSPSITVPSPRKLRLEFEGIFARSSASGGTTADGQLLLSFRQNGTPIHTVLQPLGPVGQWVTVKGRRSVTVAAGSYVFDLMVSTLSAGNNVRADAPFNTTDRLAQFTVTDLGAA